MRAPTIVVALLWVAAIVLVVIASRIEVPDRACRESDPISAFFEPSLRGNVVDPEGCAAATVAAEKRLDLRIAAVVLAGLGTIGFALVRLARKRRDEDTPAIDRGFQGA